MNDCVRVCHCLDIIAMVYIFFILEEALRSPLMVDGACKISSINQSIILEGVTNILLVYSLSLLLIKTYA